MKYENNRHGPEKDGNIDKITNWSNEIEKWNRNKIETTQSTPHWGTAGFCPVVQRTVRASIMIVNVCIANEKTDNNNGMATTTIRFNSNKQ